jgi:hypothetical protein
MGQVGKVIYDLLSNDATISAACSTRIYPIVAPQEAADPCVVYSLNSIEYNETKDGASQLDTEDWRVTTFSKTFAECESLKDATIAALNRYSGTNNGVRVNNVVVRRVDSYYDNIDRIYAFNIEFDFIINI